MFPHALRVRTLSPSRAPQLPLFFATLVAGLAPIALPAQSITPPPASPPEEVIALSPFEVSTAKDTGYQAGNTVNGSRFNTSLKDTPAAITAFTKEFLSDFRASSIEDMTAYAPNLQVDTQDRTPAATPSFLGGSNTTESRIRARGLPVGTALDFFETLIPVDNYRADRFELAAGPNSILFGFANPGGLITTTTKRANFRKNASMVSAEYGSWDRNRYELDRNQVLLADKLSLRLYGVKEDSEGWRKWDFKRLSAGTAALRFDPWKNTKFNVSYENGQSLAHITRPWNAQDMVALWQAKGSVIKDANAYVQTTDRALGLNRTTAQGYIYVAGPGSGAAPMVFGISNNNNFRVLESQYEDLNVPTLNQGGFTLLSPKQLPYDYSSYGPSSTRDVNFNRTLARLEQKLGQDGILELAFNRESTVSKVLTPQGTSVTLYGDPNSTIPNPNGNGTVIANPNAGKLYMSTPWGVDHGAYANKVVRATLGWNFDFGRVFGRHTMSLLAEHGELEQWRYPGAEILVDDNNVPILNAATPETTINRLTRRQYVTAGDFSTYYGGDGRNAVTAMINGKNYHSVYVHGDLSGSDIARTVNSYMFATQSRFWNNHIVLTAGARVDQLKFDLYDGGRVAATDPRVLSGQMIANEYAFKPGVVLSSYRYKPTTGTVGAVYHANRFLSFFGNYGSSASQPTFNAINLVTRGLNGPSKGVTHDYGFMLNLLDGRIYLRATAFETARTNWDSIVLSADPMNVVAPINRIVNALQQAGRITQAEFTAHTLPGSVRLLHDIKSEGYEASLGINVTRSFTALVNFSKTTSAYSNINLGFEDWFAGESAYLAQKAAGATVLTSTGATVQQELAAIPQLVLDGRDYYTFAFGERPYKANASGRYTVLNGTLKGLFLGAGARWQSRPKNGRLIVGRTAAGAAIYGQAFYGPEDFKVDCFVGYKRPFKIGDHKTEFSVQFNVRNATDEADSMPLRFNNNFTGLSRTVLLEPRSFRLTTGLDF